MLSILSRVYNLYQCYQDVQTLSILLGCTNFINIIRGGHCLPHIPLINVNTHPNGIAIRNKHDITHPCNFCLYIVFDSCKVILKNTQYIHSLYKQQLQ